MLELVWNSSRSGGRLYFIYSDSDSDSIYSEFIQQTVLCLWGADLDEGELTTFIFNFLYGFRPLYFEITKFDIYFSFIFYA